MPDHSNPHIIGFLKMNDLKHQTAKLSLQNSISFHERLRPADEFYEYYVDYSTPKKAKVQGMVEFLEAKGGIHILRARLSDILDSTGCQAKNSFKMVALLAKSIFLLVDLGLDLSSPAIKRALGLL
jgi:hypothetical protein